MRSRIIFFDIETRKWAEDLNPTDKEAGWDALRKGKGGACAIVLYDTRDLSSYMYDDHTAEAAARHLEQADAVVGYCSERFDLPCLEGLVGRRLTLRAHFDIYEMATKANRKIGKFGQKGDFTLDRLSKQNLGRGKIDHGSNVKELIKKGHWGKIFNYCASDVYLTRDLYAKICRDDGLITLGGRFTSLHIPDHLKGGMEVFA